MHRAGSVERRGVFESRTNAYLTQVWRRQRAFRLSLALTLHVVQKQKV
uniref:Uncharacterized protein n=1 Tax=Anguilla anguilla TaxID=7936 RepID=A0A0E9V5V9_ANGAN